MRSGERYKILILVFVLLVLILLVYLDYEEISKRSFDWFYNIAPSVFIIFLITLVFDILSRKDSDEYLRGLEEKLDFMKDNYPSVLAKKIRSEYASSSLYADDLRKEIQDDVACAQYLKFINYFTEEKRFLTALNLNVKMKIADEYGNYTLSMSERFRIPKTQHDFFACISMQEDATHALSNYSHLIDKIVCPTGMKHPKKKEEINQILTLSSDSTSDKFGESKKLLPRIVGKEEKRRLLLGESITSDMINDIILLHFDLKQNMHDRFVNIQSNEVDNLSTGYCFWSPDRPAYVNAINFDFSEVEKDIMNVNLVPFTMCPSINTEAKKDLGYWSLNLQGWVLPGQGVSLIWRKK